MKRVFCTLLVFILGTSQVLACGGGYVYSGERCSEYAWSYDRTESTPEELRIKDYRTRIDKILENKFDLTQKSDYENFLTLKEKVAFLIDTGKYYGEYKDVLCAIHLEVDDAQVHQSLWIEKNNSQNQASVLVEEIQESGEIDLYALSFNETAIGIKQVYSDVQKVHECKGIDPENDFDYEGHLETIYGEDIFIDSFCKMGDMAIIGYVNWRDTWPDTMDERSWAGGIEIYKDGTQSFKSYGKALSYPSGDVTVYEPIYLIDEDTMIVEGNSCGFNSNRKILKNGASETESIISE